MPDRLEAVERARALAQALGRDDLAERLDLAIARTARPVTVVCVVGEFKQGKSSLINALLGTDVCPVDDDLATSVITLVRHGPGPGPTVEVRRREGDATVVEAVALDELHAWVTEDGNRGNERALDRVDITVPAPILERGLVLVDTPGMGGLGAGQAAATLAFLPFADALVLASDASAELSASEADLLRRAVDACPAVVLALTKTDLHPHWQQLADVDRGHLQRLGCDVPVMPVSSTLHAAAVVRNDPGLDELSGIPSLAAAFEHLVEGPAKDLAGRRAVEEAGGVLRHLQATVRAELDALTDPAAARAAAERFDDARRRLEHLKGPGARWSVLVSDRIADLNNDSAYEFRGALRSITRTVEDEIEQLKTPKQWEALTRDLQTSVADAVAGVFIAVTRGADAIRDAVVELLADEEIELPPLPQRDPDIDPRSLWVHKHIDPEPGRLASTLVGLRGAQSGILMFGMMSRFLPGGVAAFLALSPVALGIGAAFAGVQLVDARKRKIQQRRIAARGNLRQFIDDVQFEVGNELGEALRGVQRAIRDEFSERITELQRTYAELARQAQEALQSDEGERVRRIAELEESDARLRSVADALEGAS